MNIKYSIHVFHLRLQKWQYCSVMLKQKYQINVSLFATKAKNVWVGKKLSKLQKIF